MNPIPNNFAASLISPDQPDPVAGQISITPTQLKFVAGEMVVNLPLRSLEVEFDETGAGIFFSDANNPDVKIFTWDQAILKHPAIRSHTEVAAFVGRRELMRALRLTAYFVAGGILAVLLGSLALHAMTGAIAARVPMAWEKKLGSSEIEDLQKSGRLLNDTNQVAQLTALAAPLVRVLPPDRQDLKFYIANDPEPNAFAIPGGYVVVNSGLLQLSDQPEELLGVLAHELAHQVKRHAIRSVVSAAGPVVIFGLFLHSQNSAGNAIAFGSGLMVFRGFSQRYETEADETGWDYLVAANIDPRGMIRMFKKFEALHSKIGLADAAPRALSSHPATEKRIERLEEKWQKLHRQTDFLILPPVKWSLP